MAGKEKDTPKENIQQQDDQVNAPAPKKPVSDADPAVYCPSTSCYRLNRSPISFLFLPLYRWLALHLDFSAAAERG